MAKRICCFLLCLVCAALLLDSASPAACAEETAMFQTAEGTGSVNIEWDDPLFSFECDKKWEPRSHSYVVTNRQRQSNVSTLRVSRTGGGAYPLLVALRFCPTATDCFEAAFFPDDIVLLNTNNINEVEFKLPEDGACSINIQLFYTGSDAAQESLMGQVGSIKTTVTPIVDMPDEPVPTASPEPTPAETLCLSDAVVGKFYLSELPFTAEDISSLYITNGSLPNGLWLQDVAIVGVPRDTAGWYSVTMQSGEAEGASAYSYQLCLTEQEPANYIVTDELPAAVVGDEYCCRMEAICPVTKWVIGRGKLPEGLSLSPEGNISGTPLETGLFRFILVESNGVTGDSVTEEALFISDTGVKPVLEQVLAEGDAQPEETLPNGMLGQAYTHSFAPKATLSPIWSIPSALSDGMIFDGAVITGTPAVTGEFYIDIELHIADSVSKRTVLLIVEDVPFAPLPSVQPIQDAEIEADAPPESTLEPEPTPEANLPDDPSPTQLPIDMPDEETKSPADTDTPSAE